jgi:hypothetical protein
MSRVSVDSKRHSGFVSRAVRSLSSPHLALPTLTLRLLNSGLLAFASCIRVPSLDPTKRPKQKGMRKPSAEPCQPPTSVPQFHYSHGDRSKICPPETCILLIPGGLLRSTVYGSVLSAPLTNILASHCSVLMFRVKQNRRNGGSPGANGAVKTARRRGPGLPSLIPRAEPPLDSAIHHRSRIPGTEVIRPGRRFRTPSNLDPGVQQ